MTCYENKSNNRVYFYTHPLVLLSGQTVQTQQVYLCALFSQRVSLSSTKDVTSDPDRVHALEAGQFEKLGRIPWMTQNLRSNRNTSSCCTCSAHVLIFIGPKILWRNMEWISQSVGDSVVPTSPPIVPSHVQLTPNLVFIIWFVIERNQWCDGVLFNVATPP